ncbi:MAG: hypothetical protein AAGB13_01460 [Cyanobacteria bacterium P01_F01_bin.33]
MEVVAFYALLVGVAIVLFYGLRRRYGYLQLPCLTAAVFLCWVIPQLWLIRQLYGNFASEYLVVLHFFCLACLIAVDIGWRSGVQSGKAVVIADAVTDESLVAICIAITLVAWVMVLGIGTRALEERASSTWSGPLTIMYFFSNIKVISLFLSIYLFLRRRNTVIVLLLVANIGLYAPALFLVFRRRAMLEAFTCITLALWFSRRIIIPRVVITTAIPIGMLIVFSVGSLRDLGNVHTGEPTLLSAKDIATVDFWAATPFMKDTSAPEMTNAFNMVRISADSDAHTYGAASWNRLIFQWIPGQIVGADVKQNLMLDVATAQQIVAAYKEDLRIGSTPTAMGEAYLEFGIFGIVFFLATGYVAGRWWTRANRGSRTAMCLYSAGLSAAVIMPTAYAIYFFNIIALYAGTFFIVSNLFSKQDLGKSL